LNHRLECPFSPYFPRTSNSFLFFFPHWRRGFPPRSSVRDQRYLPPSSPFLPQIPNALNSPHVPPPRNWLSLPYPSDYLSFPVSLLVFFFFFSGPPRPLIFRSQSPSQRVCPSSPLRAGFLLSRPPRLFNFPISCDSFATFTPPFYPPALGRTAAPCLDPSRLPPKSFFHYFFFFHVCCAPFYLCCLLFLLGPHLSDRLSL